MDQRICSTWPIWNHTTSTAAGPKMFETMSVGPLSCLRVTALWRAADRHYSTRITTRLGISCLLPPSLAGPW